MEGFSWFPHRWRPSALCKEISSFSYLVTHNIRKAFDRLRDFYSFGSLLPEPSSTLWNHLSFWLFNTANPACGNISLSREGTLNEFKLAEHHRTFCVGSGFLCEEPHLLPKEAAVWMILTCCTTHKVPEIGELQYLQERLWIREEVTLRNKLQDFKVQFCRITLELGKRSFSFLGHIYSMTLSGRHKNTFVNSFSLKKNGCNVDGLR